MHFLPGDGSLGPSDGPLGPRDGFMDWEMMEMEKKEFVNILEIQENHENKKTS